MPDAQRQDPQPTPVSEERSTEDRDCAADPLRLGCVSYLNSKPLIHGLDPDADPACPQVRLDVPARLLADLESGAVDLALCPVIDYFRAAQPLVVVPAGGIGCEGRTMTVRLFSRVPIDQIHTIHADTDSHTSVALVQVLLHAVHGIRPTIVDLDATDYDQDPAGDRPEAMLLIGDKVVTNAPIAAAYLHQLDLGEAWRALTGLPFVFAVWMARAETDLQGIPDLLTRVREANVARIDKLVAAYAGPLGWPDDLAREYLGRVLHYHIGTRELQAVARFAGLAGELGLIDAPRPLAIWSLPA